MTYRGPNTSIQESEHSAKEARTLSHPIIAHERLLDAKRAADIADEFERMQISEESSVNDALQIILNIIKRAGDIELLRSLAVESEGRGYNELVAKIRER